MSAADKAAV